MAVFLMFATAKKKMGWVSGYYFHRGERAGGAGRKTCCVDVFKIFFFGRLYLKFHFDFLSRKERQLS
jgi:hypothetical protein